jgi:hypothetical protein
MGFSSVSKGLIKLVGEPRIWHNKIKSFKETHESDECGPYYFYLFTCFYFISPTLKLISIYHRQSTEGKLSSEIFVF